MKAQLERIAVVTGAGRGIGAAVGRRLLDADYIVYFTDVDARRAEQHVTTLEESGTRAFALGMNVSSDIEVNKSMTLIGERHGEIAVLINNAGTTSQYPTQDVTTDSWSQLIDIHLGGTFRCARAAFPFMSGTSPTSIVNVSSIAGRMGMPIRASYCAAKAGIEGFTRSLAVEWAEFGIRVNAVAPGYVMTDLVQKDLESGLVSEATLSTRISMKRLAQPAEIAEVMYFLASNASSYITGQVINVDGGLSIDLNPGSNDALSIASDDSIGMDSK